MKKSKKVLAVMLALILTLSVMVVGVSTTAVSAAEVSDNDGGVELAAEVSDKDGGAELAAEVSDEDGGVELGAQTDTLYVGQSEYYYVRPTYSYISYVRISNSNPSVASVSGNGRGGMTVYARKAGSTKISMSIKSYSGRYSHIQNASIVITVKSKPGTPGNLRLQNYSTGFNINWNKAAGAGYYRVFYRSEYDNGWSSFVASKNYFNILNMDPGVLYYIQVRAVASNGILGGISSVRSLTHVRGTTLNSAVYNSNGTITLKWDYARGANGYAIAKAKAGTKNYSYKYVSSTSFTDGSVAAGTRYTYQIRPFYTNGRSAAYASWSNSKSITALFKPTITNMNSNYSRLNINWNAIKGAKSYKVAFKRTYDSAWNYRTTTSRYYNVPNPTKGATYVVQVCALNGNYSSPYSSAKSNTIAPPLAKPTLSGNTNSSRNYLSWNSVSGAKSYQIAKKTTQQSSYSYLTTSSTFYYDYSFTKGKTYTYQVRAFNGSTYGPWSNVMTLRPVVDKPSIYLLEKYSNRIQAEWYNVAGAAYYKVAYYKKGDSDWTYKDVYGGEFDIYYPVSNSYYVISVCAVGENGKWSEWTANKTIYT